MTDAQTEMFLVDKNVTKKRLLSGMGGRRFFVTEIERKTSGDVFSEMRLNKIGVALCEQII
mgnify:CR=1 FL=1